MSRSNRRPPLPPLNRLSINPNPGSGSASGSGTSAYCTADDSPNATPDTSPVLTPDLTDEEQSVPESAEEETEQQAGTHNKKGKYTSDCWKYFDQIFDDNGKITHGQCKICFKKLVYAAKTGTGSFNRHIAGHLKKGQNLPGSGDFVQTQLGPNLNQFHRYDRKVVKKEFVRYLIHAEKPFSMGSSYKFERFVQIALQPHYKKISHGTMTTEALEQFETGKKLIAECFRNSTNKISLTTDIWTAGLHGLCYSTVTAHWVDEIWALQKRVLAFRVLPFPHNADHIYDYIMEVCTEFGIKDRIFSISMDNATNNTASIPQFARVLRPIMNGAFFHQRCACHILNLTVQNGLSVPFIQATIAKYKDGLRHIDSTPKKKQLFRELCITNNVRCMKIPWDVDTRWNSTHRLLTKTLPMQEMIIFALSDDAVSCQYLLHDFEWQLLERLRGFLERFYYATIKLSATYTPTADLLLTHLVHIADWYATFRETLEPHDLLQIISDEMQEKFLKYWEDVPLLTIIANCLDPRHKEDVTVQMLETYRSCMQLPTGNEAPYVRGKFIEIFNIYEEQYNRTRGEASGSGSRRPGSGGFKSSIMNVLAKRKGTSSTPTQEGNNELKTYLSMPDVQFFSAMEESEFNILIWWKRHEATFPILASIARDIFGVPVSTVASEACFSAANRVLTPARNRLTGKTFEASVCVRDWCDAEQRAQDMSHMYDSSTSCGTSRGEGTDTDRGGQEDQSDEEE